jgi:hypothetical protein
MLRYDDHAQTCAGRSSGTLARGSGICAVPPRRPRNGRGSCALVDLSLAGSSGGVGRSVHARRCSGPRCRRRSRPAGLFCPVRAARCWDAGARFPAAPPCDQRVLPLCQEPHVCGGRVGHRRPGPAVRQPPPSRVRRVRLVGLSCVCLGVRGANIAGNIWERVRSVLCSRTPMGSSPAPVAGHRDSIRSTVTCDADHTTGVNAFISAAPQPG